MDSRKSRLSKLIKDLKGDGSLRELARRLDLAVGTVENWEKGRSLPDLDNLYKLAAFAGMPADALVRYLDGDSLPDPYSLEQIAGRIRAMDKADIPIVAQAFMDRLAAS